jgi:hypothetical protein
MTSKKEIMTDLKFCKELMDRLEKYADDNYQDSVPWESNRTSIKNDITRLRRELMNVSHKLDV